MEFCVDFWALGVYARRRLQASSVGVNDWLKSMELKPPNTQKLAQDSSYCHSATFEVTFLATPYSLSVTDCRNFSEWAVQLGISQRANLSTPHSLLRAHKYPLCGDVPEFGGGSRDFSRAAAKFEMSSRKEEEG